MNPSKQISMITDGKPTCMKKGKRKGLYLVWERECPLMGRLGDFGFTLWNWPQFLASAIPQGKPDTSVATDKANQP